MRGVIVGWVPHPLPALNKMTPPFIIASKCPCPYANRISEALRTDFVHKSMFCVVNNKIIDFRGFDPSCCISEAFRIDVVNTSMFYGQQQNHHFLVLGAGLTKNRFLFCCFFVFYEGGDHASV